MTRLAALRIAQAVPVMFFVAVLAFMLMHLLPGDPAVIIAGEGADPDAPNWAWTARCWSSCGCGS
jgi:peptide/nickel transport system permease protein